MNQDFSSQTPGGPNMGTGAPTPGEPKKNNNTLIIVIVVLVVLCCCCAAAAAGYYLYQNGDQIFGLNNTGFLLAKWL
jgi:hypothetical protein